jgi:hypothetical protein
MLDLELRIKKSQFIERKSKLPEGRDLVKKVKPKSS